MAFYPEKILEHARHPKNFGRVVDPDVQFEELNPLCGDRIRVELRLSSHGQILEARFSGEMCAIAKGSASILFESLEGRTVATAIDISDAEVLESLAGAIPKNRIQCALLPISALRGSVSNEGTVRC
ncbi:MAG TPA: iron-sulfur cluster assembly scaffold protein [Candidatus Binatia bacterium]|nr:iron-sulfur cluster assembly scaffold protein [Candidatus Binatia bacterium]